MSRAPADAARRGRDPVAVASVLVLALVGGSALAAPWLAPHDPAAQALERQLEPPSSAHPFGTDLKGRDLLSRTLMGARLSFAVGLAATVVSMVIGVAYGAASGYAGGRVDALMMRAVDVLYGLPYIFLVILLMAVSRSVVNLFIGLGAVQWLTVARIVRGRVLELKRRDYAVAARALGASPLRVAACHLVPNLLGPVVVYAALTVPSVMRQEAFLSFLGLGVQPPEASWGSLAAEGVAAVTPVRSCWWLVAFPGGALGMSLLALGLVGEALRDSLDPRGGRRG